MAIHAANPASFFPSPSLRTTPLAWFKYQVAKVTKARIPGLTFGYVPGDFNDPNRPATSNSRAPDEEKAISEPSTHATKYEKLEAGEMLTVWRPQTAAYALCDSPVGLLAHTLDALRPCLPQRRSGLFGSIWTPATLLNWTMMRWLPGPEAGLRWLEKTKLASRRDGALWRKYSNVPLGISQFGWQKGVAETEAVLGWADAWQRVHWMNRREGENVVRPEWEQPDDLVEDLKESFGKAWTARVEC